MPSPFPGMDPFIEKQEWEDFYASFPVVMSEFLGSIENPRYVVRIVPRVYQEVVGIRGECREHYLLVREAETKRDVTVIEFWSPGNKYPNSEGRRQILTQRNDVLCSRSHLVELDLLRSGMRSPGITDQVPTKDYYAIICRGDERPRASVWAWTIRDELPRLPIPLREGDSDAILYLQSTFRTVYHRARYDLTLDYRQPLDPPLSGADAAWVNERIRDHRGNVE